MALDDYGALLRSGSLAVQDYAGEEAKKQLLAVQAGQLRAQMAKAQQQLTEDKAYQDDLTSVLANPTAEGYAALIAKHPRHATGIKESWGMLDGKRQASDFQLMSEIYSAAGNGRHDLAAALMRRRIEADKLAGQPDDPHDQAILDALESEDPVQQRGAMGMLGVTLSAIAGPEKFGDTLGKLTDGKKRNITWNKGIAYDAETMEPIGQSPLTDVIPGARGGFFQQDYAPNIPVFGQTAPPGATPGADPTALPPPPDPAAPPAAAPADRDTAIRSGRATVTRVFSGQMPLPALAGFLGNFDVEGGYTGRKGDNGQGEGIAQWHPPRRANYQRAVGRPFDPADIEGQARFALWEMQNPEQAFVPQRFNGKLLSPVQQRDMIMNAPNAETAAFLIDKFYERSDGQHRDRRVRAAAYHAQRLGQGGGAPVEKTAQAGGKTFYKIGGQWYDNPVGQ